MNIDKYLNKICEKIDKPLVVWDLETTGINTDSDELIQFAGVRIEKNGKVQTLEFLCKPDKPVSKEAAEVHGKTNEILSKEKPFKNFVKQLQKFFEGADISGFNIKNFDVKILERQMAENGLKDFFTDKIVLDAYKIYVKHSTRKLKDALKHYTGEEIQNAHDALGDVTATIAVISKQLEIENKSVKELCSDNGSNNEERSVFARFFKIENNDKDPIVNFSKHKGKKCSELDDGFFKWMLNQSFVDKEVKDFVKKLLKQRDSQAKTRVC